MKALKENLPRVFGIAALLVVFGWVFSFFTEGYQDSFAEFCLYLTYVLLSFVVLGSLALAVGTLILNKKKLKKTLIIYGASTLLFISAWALATDDLSSVKPNLSYTGSSLQFVGGLVGVTWGLLLIAGIATLTTEVIKAFKNA